MNKRIYILLFFFSNSCYVLSQTHKNEIGFQCDNDAFLAQGSDRYYTNGFFIYYNHALKITSTTSLANKVFSLEAGQKIFNAYFTKNVIRADVDRPIAAYLYVGSALNLLYKNESNIKIGIRFGVVGPSAKGEEVQKFIHNIFGLYPVSGWRYQLQDDLELNFSGEYNKMIARISFADVSLNTYANIGNGFTGAGAGAMFRLGKFNQLFNCLSTQSSAITKYYVQPLHSKECFFYYQPHVNLVVYDATIQGSLFKKYYTNNFQVTLDPRRFNLVQQLGFAYSTNRSIINLAVLFNTKDVKQMKHSHQWGSVAYFYKFG